MLRFLQEYLAKCLPSNWHCLINTPCDPFFNWKRQIQTEKKTGIKNSVCYIDLQVLIFFWKYLCPIVTNPCKCYEEVIHEGMGRGRRGRVCASSNIFNIPFSCDFQIYLKKLMHCSIKMLLLILFLHDSHYLLNLGLSFHFSRVPPPPPHSFPTLSIFLEFMFSINETYQLISHHLLLDPIQPPNNSFFNARQRRQRRKNSHSR